MSSWGERSFSRSVKGDPGESPSVTSFQATGCIALSSPPSEPDWLSSELSALANDCGPIGGSSAGRSLGPSGGSGDLIVGSGTTCA